MLRNGWTVAMAACVLLLGVPGSARAFCRSTSCGFGEAARVAASKPPCARDADGCITEGAPLHWPSACIDYAVQVDGSVKLGIDADVLQQAAERAFAAWGGVHCPGGGSPRLKARFQGFVSCDRPEFVCGDTSKNVNTILFRDKDWDSDRTAIALTTPSGGTGTGVVVDADLEINSQTFTFDVDGTGPGAFQLNEVVAHEVGHFLGLDHSNFRGALMSKNYQTLLLSHELLTSDDIAAICAVYPPGPELDCAPPTAPAYDQCQLPPNTQQKCELQTMKSHEKAACSISVVAPRGGFGALLLVGSVLGLRRRRRGGLSLCCCRAPVDGSGVHDRR